MSSTQEQMLATSSRELEDLIGKAIKKIGGKKKMTFAAICQCHQVAICTTLHFAK